MKRTQRVYIIHLTMYMLWVEGATVAAIHCLLATPPATPQWTDNRKRVNNGKCINIIMRLFCVPQGCRLHQASLAVAYALGLAHGQPCLELCILDVNLVCQRFRNTAYRGCLIVTHETKSKTSESFDAYMLQYQGDTLILKEDDILFSCARCRPYSSHTDLLASLHRCLFTDKNKKKKIQDCSEVILQKIFEALGEDGDEYFLDPNLLLHCGFKLPVHILGNLELYRRVCMVTVN